MDEGKVEAISSWPLPSTIKELQRFLGFSQFLPPVHCQLQHHHQSPHRPAQRQSQVPVVETRLLPKHLTPSTKAFTSAPLLVHPYPELPLHRKKSIASNHWGRSGALAGSKQQGTPPRTPSSAFFSRKLSPAEKHLRHRQSRTSAIKLAP